MDAIHYHVRSEGRIIKRAVYIALGIELEGHKDVLGMYVGEKKCKILALHYEWVKKSRCLRYANCLC